MRLRRTAVPSAFLMLQPNRLTSSPLERRNMVNSRLVRLRPSRYTASYSARCKMRLARGRSSLGASDSREAVASFFAALRKNLSPALALHACAKSVLLMTAAHMGLKRTFRQRSLSSLCITRPRGLQFRRGICAAFAFHLDGGRVSGRRECRQRKSARIADPNELSSVCDPRNRVKESPVRCGY
jgi:hypothetical protein